MAEDNYSRLPGTRLKMVADHYCRQFTAWAERFTEERRTPRR